MRRRYRRAGKADMMYWVTRGNGYNGRGRDALELTRMGDSWEAEVLFVDNAYLPRRPKRANRVLT